jgi:multiple sugar transport system ATP-binding protein
VAGVAFRETVKRFDGTVALDRLTLDVHDGELLVLLGPSGCGKTTALRLVAGLEEPDGGEVLIGERVVNDVEAKDRDVAMVFQSYALYPHLSAGRNIEFPLRQRGFDREERQRRVAEAARSLGLAELLDRKPRQLSGGQRQRVALARAIVREPQAFLMDEPLSNLDAALRTQTRADIVSLQRRLGTTTLYVTHDQVEAMTMGHRIAVMDRGVLQQVDSPQALYDRPANTFVARFVGSPGMNLLPAALEREPGGGWQARVAGGSVSLTEIPEAAMRAPAAGAASGAGGGAPGTFTLGVRPEHLAIATHGTVSATVVIVELLGAEVHVACRLDDGTGVIVRQEAAAPRPAHGESVQLALAAGALHLFDESGARMDGVRDPHGAPDGARQ